MSAEKKQTDQSPKEWLDEMAVKPRVVGSTDPEGNKIVCITLDDRDRLIRMARKVERYEKALRVISKDPKDASDWSDSAEMFYRIALKVLEGKD